MQRRDCRGWEFDPPGKLTLEDLQPACHQAVYSLHQFRVGSIKCFLAFLWSVETAASLERCKVSRERPEPILELPSKNWGNRPWRIGFRAKPQPVSEMVDFAVVGGGFTGLAAAACLKRQAPDKSVALLESETFGSGASGHTGGLALAESAAGNLPGLGDVLSGYQNILAELNVDGDVQLPGVYELGRMAPLKESPIRWSDSGELRAVNEVAGGTIDPGKVVTGLAEAAERVGVLLFEKVNVERCEFHDPITLHTHLGELRATQVLLATNAYSLELTGWTRRTESCFTLAVATEPLSDSTLEAIGLASGKPFYTVDLPYLWGRLLGQQVIFGSGLVHFSNWREMQSLDVATGSAAEGLVRLEQRIRGLHPKLQAVTFSHRWGGPISISEKWVPIFERHPKSGNAIVLGGYSGHGVAQSVHLGAWAADALLGKRELPNWK
ncbi:MAG TPA: FAD-binding oxidoreductase [Candidatus Limnocylindrales bacterium]|nr:FAD-binding oxidoreductase [Candidatus Limnocylindrales bacterium]